MSEPIFSIKEKHSDVCYDFFNSIIISWRKNDGKVCQSLMSAKKLVSIVEEHLKTTMEQAMKEGRIANWNI